MMVGTILLSVDGKLVIHKRLRIPAQDASSAVCFWPWGEEFHPVWGVWELRQACRTWDKGSRRCSLSP